VIIFRKSRGRLSHVTRPETTLYSSAFWLLHRNGSILVISWIAPCYVLVIPNLERVESAYPPRWARDLEMLALNPLFYLIYLAQISHSNSRDEGLCCYAFLLSFNLFLSKNLLASETHNQGQGQQSLGWRGVQ
jgi:hypothetical protein